MLPNSDLIFWKLIDDNGKLMGALWFTHGTQWWNIWFINSWWLAHRICCPLRFIKNMGSKKHVMDEMRCATILWDMFKVYGLMEVYNVFFSHPPCFFPSHGKLFSWGWDMIRWYDGFIEVKKKGDVHFSYRFKIKILGLTVDNYWIFNYFIPLVIFHVDIIDITEIYATIFPSTFVVG